MSEASLGRWAAADLDHPVLEGVAALTVRGLDAEILLAEARGSRRIDLYTSFEDEPKEEVRTKFRQLVQAAGRGDAGGLPGRTA